MGCLIHYNWGTIKYELGPEKLFLDIKGIEYHIKNLFINEPNIDEIVKNFRKEIFETCRSYGIWDEDFRVSEVCEKIGFDANALTKDGNFYLLYDSEEVTEAERIDI